MCLHVQHPDKSGYVHAGHYVQPTDGRQTDCHVRPDSCSRRETLCSCPGTGSGIQDNLGLLSAVPMSRTVKAYRTMKPFEYVTKQFIYSYFN